jgi:hypothetical protein
MSALGRRGDNNKKMRRHAVWNALRMLCRGECRDAHVMMWFWKCRELAAVRKQKNSAAIGE